ncbi:uncharacterized protein Z518_04825 [Rhinocladiella mackenziei CBS 650.93]|uniref:Uncharacterized protein n=1 Tax=Rhinocladiella mackenziei CBS 650.93 TaxID=1442369 RepID=A0A0D2IM67_9EURO|nr:uncharacterized protein Z518_04825 [Rhinocladiella mackenziei CBS 650.93]KIX06849.1 hypothetical protein Z518_04825 [Rhinocladiella mackenziei CBS 650.93]
MKAEWGGGVPLYVPAGAGFLWKEGAQEAVAPHDHFTFVQYTARGPENISRFLDKARLLSEEMESIDPVLACWFFVPNNPGEQVRITLFVRSRSASQYGDVIRDRIQLFE